MDKKNDRPEYGKRSVLDVNKLAVQREALRIVGPCITDHILDSLAENFGDEIYSTGIWSSLLKILGGIAFAVRSPSTLGTTLGEVFIENAFDDLATTIGVGRERIDKIFQNIKEDNAEVAEALVKLVEQREEQLKTSALSGDTEVPWFSAIIDKDAKDDNKIRRFTGFKTLSDAGSTKSVLASGKFKSLPSVSKEHPVGCAAKGCTAVMTEDKDVFPAFDLEAGCGALLCKDCFDKVGVQNAQRAASDASIKMPRMAGISHVAGDKEIVALSEEDRKALTEEYTKLVKQVNEASEAMLKAAQDRHSAEELLGGALKEAEELENSGLSKEGTVYKRTLAAVGEEKAAATELVDSAYKSMEAVEAAFSKSVDAAQHFSTQHADHMNVIGEGITPPPSSLDEVLKDEFASELAELKEKAKTKAAGKAATKVLKEVTYKNPDKPAMTHKDPFPHLGPEDTCQCGKGNKHYKNCCGSTAFVNKKTGEISTKRNIIRPAYHPYVLDGTLAV